MVYSLIEFSIFILLLYILTPLLGSYMANVFTGKPIFAGRVFGGLENICYRMGKIKPHEEMTWIEYGKALLFFNLFAFCFLFAIQLLQAYLPLNPQHFSGVAWPLALNTAISFVTNTNWQAYSAETSLSYFTQMVGLTSNNFISAATGMGALLAFTRGIARTSADTIGNFWVDLVRTVVYILLPLSILFSIVLVGEGVIQTFSPYVDIVSIDGGTQTIPLGPAASQVAIKELGTNGGGFFNANSAHPFENPTPFTNFLQMLAILLIPAASVYSYGIMTESKSHGWLLFFVMFILWLAGVLLSLFSELSPNSFIDLWPNLEGKEIRIGVINTISWSISTTATSNGSVNAMLSSLSPLSGGLAMFNMMIGELIFGGVGVGLCSMLMMVMLTVFLSGLMVGRTPEYFGKKIEKREMQWVMLAILLPSALILTGSGLSCLLPDALTSLGNKGPHGLSEILYTFTSCSANNGSGFSSLNANTLYYNLILSFVMVTSRVSIILPSLAIAGLLARKKRAPYSSGSFSTDSLLFFVLLLGVILIVSALTFFPALSLGPLVEHLLMLRGQSF